MLSLTVTPGGTLPSLNLPDGVSEDWVNCTSTAGLVFHVLEAGYDRSQSKPLILLIHGFPQLACSWATIMPPLASAGFYVVAVDQRGYGRTTGWDKSEYNETNLAQFSMTNLVRDMVTLVHALGYTSVRCIVGHDTGSAIASACALIRPDMFESCIMMSQPFEGPPKLPLDDALDMARGVSAIPTSARRSALSLSAALVAREGESKLDRDPDIHFALASLPSPRKHYKWYNALPQAAKEWANPPQGLYAFLRGYFHLRSAEWEFNQPNPIKAWTASELARMPHYNILPLYATMAEAVLADMEPEDYRASESWLSVEDLTLYVEEWERTGFQGALNYFRVVTDPAKMVDMSLFASKRIEVPSIIITGNRDWANFEDPGALQNIPKLCKDFRGIKIVRDAGHWPHQEQPGAVSYHILNFIWTLDTYKRGVKSPSSASPSKNSASDTTTSTPSLATSNPAPNLIPSIASHLAPPPTAASNSINIREPGIASAPLKPAGPTLEELLEHEVGMNMATNGIKNEKESRTGQARSRRRGRSVPRNKEDVEQDTQATLPSTVYTEPERTETQNAKKETTMGQTLATVDENAKLCAV